MWTSLTTLPDLGFFSWGLVGRLCDLPFPGALGALTFPGSFPFLVPDVSRRHVRGSQGGWLGHHCHSWGKAPNVGYEKGKQVWGFFLETHVY